ncbi:TPA: hypothetical protein R4K21_001390 [Stenotrophomonas maltophilia]|nr:hypothetical protein [Stenotrophomonas maltophilia]
MKTVTIPALQTEKHLVRAGGPGGVKAVYNWNVHGWSEERSRFGLLATFWSEEDANLFIKAKDEQ